MNMVYGIPMCFLKNQHIFQKKHGQFRQFKDVRNPHFEYIHVKFRFNHSTHHPPCTIIWKENKTWMLQVCLIGKSQTFDTKTTIFKNPRWPPPPYLIYSETKICSVVKKISKVHKTTKKHNWNIFLKGNTLISGGNRKSNMAAAAILNSESCPRLPFWQPS